LFLYEILLLGIWNAVYIKIWMLKFCYIFIHTSNCLPSHVQWNIGLNVGNSQSKLLKHWPLFPLLIDDHCQVEYFKKWFARWKILSLCRPSSLPFFFPFHMECFKTRFLPLCRLSSLPFFFPALLWYQNHWVPQVINVLTELLMWPM
jgi:hypothetical protein